MNRRGIAFLILSLGVLLATWCVGAFVGLSFNPLEWSLFVRAASASLFLVGEGWMIEDMLSPSDPK